MADHVMVPVAVGELFDKISILEIKAERIQDLTKLSNVRTELALLNHVAIGLECTSDAETIALRRELKTVNEAIWDAENRVRHVAARDGFGEAFAEIAKVTYQNNDRRAEIKRRLSLLSGSLILEEKSHSEPTDEVRN